MVGTAWVWPVFTAPPLAPPTNPPTGDKETLIQKQILSQYWREQRSRGGEGGRLTGAVNNKYINTYIISIHTYSHVVMAVAARKQVTCKKIKTNNKIKYFLFQSGVPNRFWFRIFVFLCGGSKWSGRTEQLSSLTTERSKIQDLRILNEKLWDFWLDEQWCALDWHRSPKSISSRIWTMCR